MRCQYACLPAGRLIHANDTNNISMISINLYISIGVISIFLHVFLAGNFQKKYFA